MFYLYAVILVVLWFLPVVIAHYSRHCINLTLWHLMGLTEL